MSGLDGFSLDWYEPLDSEPTRRVDRWTPFRVVVVYRAIVDGHSGGIDT